MANGDAAIFGHFADDFDEFLTSFLAEFRKEDANAFALDRGGQAKIAFLNRFFDRMKGVDVPGLDGKGAWFGGGNSSELANPHLRAVDFRKNVFNQSGRRFACADTGKFVDYDLLGFDHLVFG